MEDCVFGTQAKINDKQNTDDMRSGTVFLRSADNTQNIATVRRVDYPGR